MPEGARTNRSKRVGQEGDEVSRLLRSAGAGRSSFGDDADLIAECRLDGLAALRPTRGPKARRPSAAHYVIPRICQRTRSSALTSLTEASG
jgi:hypothetical protein